MTKIAVLMSTYNGEKYIRQQLDSILAQNVDAEVDIIVRDDGSKDRTLDILREYNINYYTGNNLGPARSFFDLIRSTSGYDYYAFADQDDYWNDDKLEKAVELIEHQDGPAITYSNPELVDADLKSLGRKVYKNKPKTNLETVICAGNIIGCTVLFNEALASIVRKRELPGQIRMHDYYLAAICVAIGGSVIYDDNSYMKYRQHGNNTEGVPTSKLQAVKNRLKEINTKSKVSIADQALEIVTSYEADVTDEGKRWLLKTANYRNNLITRLAMALSPRTHYITNNKSISVRCTILLGNR